MGKVTGHSEVRILIDGSWNQALNVSFISKDMWERVRERWDSLHWWESKLSNIIRFIKSKNTLDLIKSDMLLYSQHIWVEILNIFNITEDESLFCVKSKSDDILNIAYTHSNSVFKFKLFFVNIFFIIGDLYDKWKVKYSLEILCEDKWDGVTQMESLSRWTSTSIEVEWLHLLICVQADIKVSMAEEHTSSDKSMWPFTCHLFDLCNEFWSHS